MTLFCNKITFKGGVQYKFYFKELGRLTLQLRVPKKLGKSSELCGIPFFNMGKSFLKLGFQILREDLVADHIQSWLNILDILPSF